MSGGLEALLNWEVIDTMFEREEHGNPLAELTPEIAEPHSLVKLITDLTVECQRMFVYTGQTALLGLTTLKLTTLKIIPTFRHQVEEAILWE